MTIALAEALGSDVFRWGIDLFNHGYYYWEAHEAWEPLWHAANEARSTACSSKADPAGGSRGENP
ncbi:DUF309 domain-containing protein [Mesorhizobium sp. M0098]|nr:DUF309 domain-containing protein [Mesorhizobium sp. M7A.F.Ca.US.010.02.1.1]